MDIIYPYYKYEIYCQLINPPNYVIKTLQGNINWNINQVGEWMSSIPKLPTID